MTSRDDTDECRPIGWIVQPRPIEQVKSQLQRGIDFSVVSILVSSLFSIGTITLLVFYGIFIHIVEFLQDTSFPNSFCPCARTVLLALSVVFLTAYAYHWQRNVHRVERANLPNITLRYSQLWHRIADYFPIQLVISEELLQWRETQKNLSHQEVKLTTSQILPNDRNYLVGYHPHGVLAVGTFTNFMTEATGFSRAFPGLISHVAVLKLIFKVPIIRDLLMAFGATAATETGIRYLLDQNLCNRVGNFVVVVVGGAPEVLDANPGRYQISMKRRLGFFKLALQTGSSLVPCISFGEANMYHQVPNPRGSRLRWFQEWILQPTTLTFPLCYARGPFPYRTPVNTVVGAPIGCEKIVEPTMEQVSELKEKYMTSLKNLFDQYKPVYDIDADELEFV